MPPLTAKRFLHAAPKMPCPSQKEVLPALLPGIEREEMLMPAFLLLLSRQPMCVCLFQRVLCFSCLRVRRVILLMPAALMQAFAWPA